MNISTFIRNNMEAILQDWEDFAESIQPRPGGLDRAALRDEMKAVMLEIADDLETQQGKHEQAEKSKGRSPKPATVTAAGHGLQRLEVGFSIVNVLSEYRALRASIIRLWNEIVPHEPMDVYELVRLNEAIDQRIQEAAESHTAQSETRTRQFDTVLSSSPDHSYILDGQGKFVYANRAMLEDLDVSAEELIGKSHLDLGFSESSALHHALEEVIRTANRAYGEVKYCFPSGEVRYFEYVYTPVLDEKKRVQSVAATEHDVTSRKENTETLRQSLDQLLGTVNELEGRVQEAQAKYFHTEKLAKVGTLSASIAHELGSPLQALIVFLRSLRRWSNLEEQYNQVLDSAINEIDRMNRLMRNLRDLYRPSTGHRSTVDIHASIDALLLLLKSDFKRRRIVTEVHFSEHLPQIEAVQDQIKQVLLNLLKNAADACRDGGVITISTWREDGRVAVSIQDNGAGIPADKMESIFQPFFTTKSEGKGFGLGLSICQEIVQNHHGEIRAESKPGEGATFTVLLPIDQ